MLASRRRTASVVAVLAVLLAAGAAWWWVQRPDSRFAQAAGWAPGDTQRVTWTDWAGVRAELGSDGHDLTALLSTGEERDLVTTSALGSSAQPMQDSLGLSPTTLEWELLSQGTDGAALFLRVPDSVAFDDLGDRLEGLGYQRPDESDRVWKGGVDVASSAGFSPQLQHLVLLEDERLVVTSDRASYASTAAATVRGDAEPVDGLDEVVKGAGDALSAVAMTGEYACEHLAMAQADEQDAAQGELLVEKAGDVHPLAAFALAAGTGDRVTALFSLADEQYAEHDARARAALASGPAPGQGGEFEERFSVRGATAEGSLVRLTLTRVPGAYVLGDLSSGPLLFASC